MVSVLHPESDSTPDPRERLARWLYIYRYFDTPLAVQNWDEGWCETKDHYRADARRLIAFIGDDAR